MGGIGMTPNELRKWLKANVPGITDEEIERQVNTPLADQQATAAAQHAAETYNYTAAQAQAYAQAKGVPSAEAQAFANFTRQYNPADSLEQAFLNFESALPANMTKFAPIGPDIGTMARGAGVIGLMLHFLFETGYEPVVPGPNGTWIKNPIPPPVNPLNILPNPLGSTPFFNF